MTYILVNPTYTKIVYGEGMPKSDGSGNGNLTINIFFNSVIFLGISES